MLTLPHSHRVETGWEATLADLGMTQTVVRMGKGRCILQFLAGRMLRSLTMLMGPHTRTAFSCITCPFNGISWLSPEFWHPRWLVAKAHGLCSPGELIQVVYRGDSGFMLARLASSGTTEMQPVSARFPGDWGYSKACICQIALRAVMERVRKELSALPNLYRAQIL